jgi:hypothetical protein
VIAATAIFLLACFPPDPLIYEIAFMKARAHHHTQHQWHLWMPFNTALLMVTLTASAWGEANTQQSKSAVITNTKPYGQFPLLLSTTLSMPENTPDQTVIPPKIVAAQDSIEKEKILADLNIQIAAMEQLIKAQKSQIEGSTRATDSHETLVGNSAMVSLSEVSGVLADSRMAGVSKSSPSEVVAPGIPAAAIKQESRVKLLPMLGIKQVLGLALIVLALAGLVWHRKYHQVRQQSANNQAVLLPWEQTLKIPAARQDKAFVDLDMTEVRK